MLEVNSKRKNINRGFRKLNIWQLSIEYYKLIVEVLSKYESILFKVRAQIQDSALSISSNIAEGYARRTLKENLRFNEIALSSSAENCSQLHALKESGQISPSEFELLDTKLYEVENKIIRMNKTLIKKLNNGAKWNSDY
jgi:four helix bundle protein